MDLKKLTPGLHLYNLKTEKIIKVQHQYDLDRVLYIPQKQISIILRARVTNPETACCALISQCFRPLDEVVEERADRFVPQLEQKDVGVVQDLMENKIKSALARKTDSWGVNVDKVSVRITDRPVDEEDIPPSTNYTVYS